MKKTIYILISIFVVLNLISGQNTAISWADPAPADTTTLRPIAYGEIIDDDETLQDARIAVRMLGHGNVFPFSARFDFVETMAELTGRVDLFFEYLPNLSSRSRLRLFTSRSDIKIANEAFSGFIERVRTGLASQKECMESLNDFLFNLNTARQEFLQCINDDPNFARAVEAETQIYAPQSSIIETIEDCIAMLEESLAFAHGEPGTVTVENISQNVKAFCDANHVRAQIQDDIIIRCNHGRLLKTIVDIINNACDFGSQERDAQGMIVRGVWVSVHHNPVSNVLIVRVTDDGPGIIAANLAPGRIPGRARIYDPDFTDRSRGKGKGTGLGLAQARRSAEMLGGTLALETSTGPVNHGTTFELRVPIEAHPSAAIAPPGEENLPLQSI